MTAAAALDAAELAEHLIKLSPAVSFEVHAALKPKDGPVIEPGQARANIYQTRIAQVIVWCLMHERPIRIIGLKPRQKGSSTFFVWCLYHLSKLMHLNSCIIGGAHWQGDNLFRILKRYAEKDTWLPDNRCRVVDQHARWANGSECFQQTAGSPNAGVSATFQFLLATEVAKWAEEGVANAADVLSELLKCVAEASGTFIGLESTAWGASGDFYVRWCDAITFEELQAGKDGFVRVFAAWFEFEDSRRDPRLEEGKEQVVPPEKVAEVRAQYGLDDEQIAWMQWATREQCKKDFETFCQDYPFDWESAFLKSGKGQFNRGQLKKMAQRALLFPPSFGMIDVLGDEERHIWRGTDEGDANIVRWEPPRAGCRYLLAVDVMTGATQAGGKDPDNHSVSVWRAGYYDDRGWHPPRHVARLINDWTEWTARRKYRLIWDIGGVLEPKVWALAQYYGNCRIVVEFNKDSGLLALLGLRNGVQLYHRMVQNKREQTEVPAPGFLTTENTRGQVIDTLTRAIREQGEDGSGVDIFCPILLGECESFVRTESGRCEAASGCHDDTVLEAAIALTVIEAATVYSKPVTHVALPRDIERLLEMERGQARRGMASRW